MRFQIASNERHLQLSAADGAPGFEELFDDTAFEFIKTEEKPVPIQMNDHNADWDILYPFSSVCDFIRDFKSENDSRNTSS